MSIKGRSALSLTVAAAAAALVTLNAAPAFASATFSAKHDDNVGGCDVHTEIQYDLPTNQSTLTVTYHNGNLTSACRETSGGALTMSIYGTEVQFKMPIHATMACAYLDPTCPHDLSQSFTDYTVVPQGLLAIASLTALQVKTVGGYASTVW